jgi:hypothetical protein
VIKRGVIEHVMRDEIGYGVDQQEKSYDLIADNDYAIIVE